MKERNSKAIFKDGHEEKIVYFERSPLGMVFVTKSGMYIHRRERVTFIQPDIVPIDVFYRVNFASPSMLSMSDTLGHDLPAEFTYAPIKTVQLDLRVEYDYALFKKNDDKEVPYTTGTILVKPNASDLEIRLAILKDQLGFDDDIRWRKRE